MSEEELTRIGPHDLGGMPGGPVERDEHDLAHWERRVDALVMLLFRKGVLKDAAELRRGIESLGPESYAALTYYERWAASAAMACLERGLVTREELDERMARLRKEAPAR